MRWFFLLLPWLELWTLIELGAATSGLWALFYVFVTLMLGMGLIRRQGLSLLRQMQREAEGRAWLGPQLLMDDLALVTAGLLLVIPGLITDCLAIVVLIGPLRRRLLGMGRWEVERGGYYRDAADPFRDPGDPGEPPLEGDFRRLDDDQGPP